MSGSGFSRRAVLKAGLAVGGGLLVEAFDSPALAQSVPTEFRNMALRIDGQGTITLILNRVEMGQGTTTAQAQLVAEELDIDPRTMRVEQAPTDRVYDNPAMGSQITGGSTSTATSFAPYREAGAAARMMMIEAFARTTGVPASECDTGDGRVRHRTSGRSAPYGDLVGVAATLKVPKVFQLKRELRVVGQSVPRLDAPAKVFGTAEFGLDVQVPGALVAVVVRSPVLGGRVHSVDAAQALGMPGVTHVVEIPSGVAVVATTYWHARAAAQQVKVRWIDGPMAEFNSDELVRRHRALVMEKRGHRVRSDGDVSTAWDRAHTVVEAEYQVPFLAHTPMEPLNATAHVQGERCEIWAATQAPGLARFAAARALGLPSKSVTLHTTLLGGGFGRRAANDFVVEAAQVSRLVQAPVKLVWSREDDVKGGYYRPAATHFLKAALNADGSISAWWHGVATQSILGPAVSSFAAGGARVLRSVAGTVGSALATRDPLAFEGAESLPYSIPHVAVDYFRCDTGVPAWFWRSVGHSHTAFAAECFLDELVAAGGRDPFEVRRELLRYQPRHRWVLELAAEKAGWGTPLPPGVHRGIAVHKSFGSWAAAVAEVSVEEGRVRVHRVVTAIDCGTVVNPDIVKSQLESATVYGLSAALKQRLTVVQGRVQQSNFHDYEPLRIGECPRIEAYVRPNGAPPTGVGEPGVPVVAPAVANAVFAATGRRLRSLPLSLKSG